MGKHKSKGAMLAAAAILSVALLAGCTQTADSSAGASEPAANTGDVTLTSASDKVKAEDLDASWDEDTATKINLDGDSITVNGEGATATGSTVTITAAGTYLLRGELTDGQVVVEAPDDDLVRLVMDGATLRCEDSAPINCVTADKLLIILADGSENVLTDGAAYTFPDATTDEPSATLFSKQNLTINGMGSLSVTASYNNGIGTKDDLIIVSGDITVTAANHAIRGRDSVTVLDGTLTLDAGKDGIQSNNADGEDKGWIELYGGSYDITAANDGIQAETTLAVFGGEYDIVAGGGSANAPERAEEFGGFGGGAMPEGMTPPDGATMPEGMTPPEGFQPTDSNGDTAVTQLSDTSSTEDTTDTAAETDEAASDSFKGIKSVGDLTISGGNFTIDSADDALHSNADLTISGGTFDISTGDDAAHADANLLVEGEPVITVLTCYEGMEGTYVTVNGGTIDITATDDGLNAAGGSSNTNTEETTGEGMFGADQFGGKNIPGQAGDYMITISGGTITINAAFDGLDSNGAILMTGGELYVSGSTIGGGDGAIDCDGTFNVEGGTFVAAGGASFVIMGEGAGADSAGINADGTQPVLNFQFSQTKAAGTVIELRDDSGNTLVFFTAQREFTQVAFTHADMQDGQGYTVFADGEEVSTVTLSGMMTSLSDTGESVDTAMQGPGGGMGGMPGRNG